MADNMERQLAEGVEQDLGLKAMAERFAPRGAMTPIPSVPPSPIVSQGTIEAKLQQIEKLVSEIRSMSAQVKGLLG